MLRKQAHVGAFQQTNQRSTTFSYSSTLSVLVSLILLLGFTFPLTALLNSSSEVSVKRERWHTYTLPEAVRAVARNKTVILCAVSQPYLPFLINWLTSIAKHHRHHGVLVVAEDYATLYAVNEKWPGHAVLIPPAPALQQAHKFGSQGFFNFTSRRPRHLLQILELGYSVLYNDVDMVWLKDPFPYFKGKYDIYFTDDMAQVSCLFSV
ncbi:hypothetical protein L7F22_018109 [Adiantum nelumboides]|nr:hypothetical protein [Adiantum nelumboides]